MMTIYSLSGCMGVGEGGDGGRMVGDLTADLFKYLDFKTNSKPTPATTVK